jgi:2',5'-phosphodiesterase
MRANAAPKQKKNKKAKGGFGGSGGGGASATAAAPSPDGENAAAPTVALFADAASAASPIDPSTRNLAAWAAASLLVVGGERFAVRINPPSVGGLAALGGGASATSAGGNGTAPATALSNCRPPMVGYPLLPAHELRFADPDCCSWRWLRRRVAAAEDKDNADWEETGASDACYTPTEADLGCLLRVECIPARRHAGQAANAAREAAGLAPAAAENDAADNAAVEHGEPGFAETTSPVARGPSLPAHTLRALAPSTSSTSTSTFRVMSYNILANQYASNSYARTVLFGYCPPQFLAVEYRRQLVLAEIKAHAPDALLLQEVDSSAFFDYYLPHLRRLGYEGRYTNKLGRVREGSATFWRTARFRLAGERDVDLRRAFERVGEEEDGPHAQFAPLVRASPALAEALQKVTTIAQVTLLLPAAEQDAGEGDAAARPLLVANTHLFFHPFAPHIRTMHTAAILEEAASALRDWEQGVAGRGQAVEEKEGEEEASAAAATALASELARRPPAAFLYGGDLNSDLNDGVPGVVELLQTGRLSRDHWDWRCGASFRWGKGEEEYADEPSSEGAAAKAAAAAAAAKPAPDGNAVADANLPSVVGVDVSVPFGPLRSADGLRTPYTNYTSGYKALLDYIWLDPKELHVRRVLPAPPERLLQGFIPSESFPSDHLAVVFDLDWVVPDGEGESSGKAGDFVTLPVAAAGAVAAAAARLAKGGVIALPTDTLYGLAADARDPAAVAALKAVKGRDAEASPLAVAVADVEDVSRVAETGALPEGLLEALLPGPVTVLLPPRTTSNDGAAIPLALEALGASKLIGVRVPNCEWTRAACRALAVAGGVGGQSGAPAAAALALTSANLSGDPSPLRATDFRALWPKLAAVFDGGPVAAASAAGSTVVDLSKAGEARIVRAGVAADNVARLLSAERFGPLKVVSDAERGGP